MRRIESITGLSKLSVLCAVDDDDRHKMVLARFCRLDSRMAIVGLLAKAIEAGLAVVVLLEAASARWPKSSHSLIFQARV